MEDEERQKKLEAGKAKLAEYRQRKAHADGQKKQKKKKKKRIGEDSEGEIQGSGDAVPDPSGGGGGGGDRDGEPPTTEFTFARTLRSGETVKHDQTYTIEPESEMSTTAEDYSSEEEVVDPLQKEVRGGGMVQDMEDQVAAETQAVELEEIRAFGTEGVQQLQDFEAALKQRDGIITQLTANLQQARREKDETMREFLELTEQSQKLHIQFQQLQAGDALRNTSHSSTAADLLQARQQAFQHQQHIDEMAAQVRGHEERSKEQLLQIAQLQHSLNEAEMVVRRMEESFAQRLNEKELLIAEQEKVMLGHEHALKQIKGELAHAGRGLEESFTQRTNEQDLLISEQSAIIKGHEWSLSQLKEELAQVGRKTEESFAQRLQEKDLLIAQHGSVVSERDCSITQLKDALATSERLSNDLNQQMAAKIQELESCRVELESRMTKLNSYKGDLETSRAELDSCKGELLSSRQKERMSSTEIQQLMGTVEDLQKRCHQDSLSESDALKRLEEDSVRRLEHLRSELDEMYGQQIVQMKQELRSQHSADVDRLMANHRAELELLKSQQPMPIPGPGPEVAAELNLKIVALQERLQESEALHTEATQELNQVVQEKLNLQVQVEDLLSDLHTARSTAEQASQKLASQENQQGELQRLQDTIDDLRAQLAVAEEAAEETEAKHESETTNYKIKLEMMEREKDAVLDRMAESQEAELERLRTQLLFSHEEELSLLREDLQRESHLNAENLLNESATKHERALEQLRCGFENKLCSLENERAEFAAERDELLHQIVALKEDLTLALHSSKAEELVEQLQELQVEVEELRKEGSKQVGMEDEMQKLLRQNELLGNESKEKEERWDNKWKELESEKQRLKETNNSMKEEVASQNKRIEFLTAENEQMLQQVVELRDEIDKQRNTFSFAEKNFEVNYQELKEEYTCLIEVKAQLEGKILKETLAYEAKLSSLLSENRELKENNKSSDASADHGALMEKDTTELMEKLEVALKEKDSATARLAEVMEELSVKESELERLEAELGQGRVENEEVVARNKTLETELEKEREILKEREREIETEREAFRAARSEAKPKQAVHHHHQPAAPACTIKNHPLQIKSLRGEVEVLRSSLRKAQMERDSSRSAPVPQHRQTVTKSLSAAVAKVPTKGEGPVEDGPSSKPAGSNARRKRRQKGGKQDRPSSAQSEEREEKKEEEVPGGDRAGSAAERARMESGVASPSQRRVREADDASAGYHGDAVEKQEQEGAWMEPGSRPMVRRREEAAAESTEHAECELHLEAQRLSLSQIHAAQLELLRDQTDAHTRVLEQELGRLKEHRGTDEPKALKYQSVIHAVSQDCKQLILSFASLFGEEFLQYLYHSDVEDGKTLPVEKEELPRDPSSMLQEAKEVCRDLQQLEGRIEEEYERLLQLQSLLKADGNKIEAIQTAYDELRVSSETEISVLRMQIDSSRTSMHQLQNIPERTTAPTMPSEGAMDRLEVALKEQQSRLEERHGQEMKRLRSDYQQQAKESQEVHDAELSSLQQRLLEVTSSQSQLSLSSATPLSSQWEEEGDVEELKLLLEEEVLEGGLDAELRSLLGSAGPPQLQALRRALCHKYVRKVAALREQHHAEVSRLREEREQRGERRRGGGEAPGRGGADTGEASVERTGGGVERHLQETVEEEIAKVIVQMSVEFAQQNELALVAKRARETTSAMQTEEEEGENGEGEGQTRRGPLGKGASSLEEVERKFMEQREKLERDLKERTAELCRLKEQLLHTAVSAEQKEGEERGREEGDEEEVRKKGGLGAKVSSEDGGLSSAPDVITTERNLLRKANESLRQVLCDVLKTTAAAEETIGRHVEGLLEASSRGQHPTGTSQRATWQRDPTEPFRPYGAQAGDATTESYQSSETGAADDMSVWSGEMEVDEGLDVSRQTTDILLPGADGLLPGAELPLENEEYLMNISTRLQAAVEKLLVAITETTNQLEHARLTQTELMRESFRHNQEMGELLQRQEELQDRLGEEARAREHLALELHRAEGLIDGYTGERAALEEQLRQKQELHLTLEQELQVTSSRLNELEQERLQMLEERELLARQQDAMREVAGPRELYLLEETEKLMKEKVDVQRQAEKESLSLLKQVKVLEAELEEQVNRVIELEHAQKTENGDLQQQIQALEKQLEKNRKFLDEQAIDREHERDVFQQEILKLEQQLKNPQKLLPGSEQRSREVDQLTSQLKEKADWCSELLLGSEQLQREVSERNEEIDKLEGRVRELEQALLAGTPEKTEDKRHVSVSEAGASSLEAQLQTEREALDRKEKEISNLEEQLEQFREELENKSEEVQQLHMQLEIQSKELSTQQYDLATKDNLLRVIKEKESEIALLNEQNAKLRHTETASDNKEFDNDKDELIRDLESQVECMRSEQERLKRNNEDELDQLNAVIEKLQEELANIEQKQAAEDEEDLKGQGAESHAERPSQDQYDEMKQRMDLATKELDTLKADHGSLLDTYRRLKVSAVALAETEQLEENSAAELEEALREKTAGFVVMQAQVQALEHSATARVDELGRRVQELEDLVGERDSELARCRFLVEKTQEDAKDLQQKVSKLEEKLRERVAAALVSQAQLGAVQQQSQGSKDQTTKEPEVDARDQTDAPAYDFNLLGMPQLDFSGLSGARQGPSGRVVLLTEKLRELEVGLSGMQKDQELQKQLLSSSEEEVVEYERRLAVLMELLNQMRMKPSVQHRRFPSTEVSQVSLRSAEVQVSEVHQELKEVQEEAAATKEELDTYREHCEKQQQMLQEREVTIAHLQAELHQTSSEGAGSDRAELHQELQEVREEASATKEQLNSFRECTEKLQDELQVRDLSIAQLQEELQQLRTALSTATERPSPSPSPQLSSSASSSSQPKKKGGKQQAGKGPTAKDKPPLVRKSSATATSQSSDKSRTASLTSGPQRGGPQHSAPQHGAPQHSAPEHSVLRTDTATQTEPAQAPALRPEARSASEEEEVQEVIGEYQEKIAQMQELHAAEIMDMETRHIAESEALRRDGQLLEEECKALRAAIDKLRSSEAPSSRPERPATSQLKDGYTSDSSSDWSQRTGYDLPNLQQEFRITPEGARRETDDALPDRIKNLLREVHQEGMQVLNLSELPLGEGEGDPATQAHGHGSFKERDALVATVESLKNLVTQMQTHRETQAPGGVDWRAGLLGAVQQVFERERSVLKSALYARLDLLDTSDAVVHLNQLEQRLAQQDAQHREAMGNLHAADRTSLLSEIRQLRVQLEQLQGLDLSQGASSSSQGVQSGLQEQRERGMPHGGAGGPHGGAVGPHSGAGGPHGGPHSGAGGPHGGPHSGAGGPHGGPHGGAGGPHGGAGGPLGGAGGHHGGPHGGAGGPHGGAGGPHGGAGGPQDPHSVQAERLLLGELKAELSQTKLELETTLKAQHKHLKELDTLRAEVSQKAVEVHALSDQLAGEQRRSREQQWALEKERCKSDKKEETEREALEDLKLTLEDHQNQVTQLTSALDQERRASSELSLQARQEQLGLQSRLSELQVQLESERARAQEMDSVLGRERELRRSSSQGGRPSSQGEEGSGEEELAEGGGRSLEAVLEGLQKELDEKHAKVVGLLSEVEAQKLEAVRRQEELTSAGRRSQQDQEALRESRAQLELLEERAQEARAQLDREVQRRKALEQEKERLEERLARLGEGREEERARSGTQRADNQNQAVWGGEPTDRTRDWVFQQKTSDAQTVNPAMPSLLEGTGRGEAAAPHDHRRSVDAIVVKLHLIATKIRSLTSQATDSSLRPTTEVDTEDLSWLQSNIDEVITMLQQSPGLPSVPESAALLAGSSATGSLTERLLRQNAELTGFVSRLTEEKNDLRNQSLRLEDELHRYRQAGLGSGASFGSRRGVDKTEAVGALFTQEREAWSRERNRLEKALRVAQAEMARLRGEIRTEALRDLAGPEADNATLKRMYGKYLRSESFRKALIYQKKYLLLLLGGFQECEEATLSLIVRMGGRPSHASLESLGHRRRGLTRFRSAVRVSIALSRMRFLVKRWQKATGMGSASPGMGNRNGLAQTPGSEVRDTLYLQPGSVEVYGERRGGASRGRSGRDSPRSALSSAQNRFHLVADHGSLSCSHLQNYDPDRALTDYISRLEALQRRLGSVTSGSSSYAQLHFGMRR